MLRPLFAPFPRAALAVRCLASRLLDASCPLDCTFAGVDAYQLQPNEMHAGAHGDTTTSSAAVRCITELRPMRSARCCTRASRTMPSSMTTASSTVSSDMALALADAALGVAHGVEAQAPHHRGWAV